MMPLSKFRSLLVLTLTLALSCKKPGAPLPSASISELNCAGITVGAPAIAGAAFNGTITIPYTGGNGSNYAAGPTIQSEGVTGLNATLQAGTLANGAGGLTFNVTGIPSGPGAARFTIAFGARTCVATLAVAPAETFTQYGTPFAGVPDRQDAVIYQVNLRAFSAGGNFGGVIARLDSIRALGTNVIYLMPIFAVGTLNAINSPYAVRDYRAVNPEFGNLGDLRALVDGAHSRNMSVLLDWVANHTAWDHPWISQYPDWYQKNTGGAIISPPGTGWNDVAQLNFNQAAMRLEMIRSLKYWVYTANVDGFRFDFADGPPASFWRQMVDSLRNITTHKLLLLAEGNRSDHYASGFDFTFGFNWYGALRQVASGGAATGLEAVHNTELAGATNGQQVVRYLTNHDVNSSDGTPQELFGGLNGSMAYFVATAYMGGVPMIYNGQEVGTPFRLLFPFTGADIDWSLHPAVTAEYKRVIAFRNSSAALRRGTFTEYSNANVAAFTRVLGAERVLVLANLRNSAQNYSTPSALAGTTWTDAFTGAAVTVGAQVSLPAYGYLVLRN